MKNVKKHLSILGFRVEDKVTGKQGVVASVSFDLYGCVQAIVNPGQDKDGKLQEQVWFDIARLKVISDTPVMDVPNWEVETPVSEGKKGPAEKPSLNRF